MTQTPVVSQETHTHLPHLAAMLVAAMVTLYAGLVTHGTTSTRSAPLMRHTTSQGL